MLSVADNFRQEPGSEEDQEEKDDVSTDARGETLLSMTQQLV